MLNMSRTGKLLTPILASCLILSGCTLLPWLASDVAVAQMSGCSYSIVDTSQELTYDNVNSLAAQPQDGEPFYRQDAQIDGNQPSYRTNGDGTVTDLVTGLMWTQDYYGKMTATEALASAASFSLAGYSDWRLPTIKELYSLIDFSGEDVDPLASSANSPFIDTTYFAFAYGDTPAGERIIDSQWATSTIYTGSTEFAGGSTLMFGVNFADGRIKGYPVQGNFYVRYVRGNAAYGENNFLSNGDGTISDLATGLMWAQEDSGIGMNWEEALAYVVSLNDANYLGYSDWHLPNAKELQSIVDYTRSPDTTNSAAIDPVFNVTSITNEAGERDWGFYWTGTTHASARGGQAAVYIAFGRGLGYMNNRYVDVHGAGCQRSDPKTGSAEPYGRGPQGDVVRVQNLVRPVRNESATRSATSSNPSLGSSEAPDSDLAINSSDGSGADYILFAPLGEATAYLIDRDGNIVNDWSLSGRPGNSVYLTEGGNLLATYTVQGSFSGGGIGGGVQLLTWDGAEVWSFELATDHAHLHHDVCLLPSGNVLLISWESFSRSEALAAGLSANQLPESGEVWSEMILEYDPDSNQIVWEWHLWDHVLPEGQTASEHPEKIDLDYFANPHTSDWWHFNSVDYSAELDQIVVSSRAASEFWIIDHGLTTAEASDDAGDLLYRYGNPEAYGASGIQGLLHQHDAEFITDELLAEGNSGGVASSSSGTGSGIRILVFDNGDPKLRPYSRVLELDLPKTMSGSSSQARVLPAQIVWQYPSEQDASRDVLFADHISGAQRLENGNTLICSGTEGRFLEVTPDGEVVWEYVNPFTSTGRDGKASNEVFRAEAYSAGYIGQDLGATSPGSATTLSTSLPSSAASPGTGSMPVPGISSIEPTSIAAGSTNEMITISLNDRFAPPEFVQFSSIAIRPSLAKPNSQATGGQVADIQASAWSRSGLILRAWFDIPEQLPAGEYLLTVTFPGRDGESITFTGSVRIN